jgi:sugar (pentulose or hexulose) kinase
MVNVDDHGNPLRPAIIWLDQRKARQVYIPRGLMKIIYRAIRMEEPIHKVQIDGKCNWLRQFQLDVWEKTHKYLQYRLSELQADRSVRDSIASDRHIPMN